MAQYYEGEHFLDFKIRFDLNIFALKARKLSIEMKEKDFLNFSAFETFFFSVKPDFVYGIRKNKMAFCQRARNKDW